MIAAIMFALLQAAAPAQAPAAPATISWTVRPETVTVAEPFNVTITVHAPLKSLIAFPAGPDTAQPLEALDPPVVKFDIDSAGAPVRTAIYRLQAWQTGAQSLTVPVQVGAGAEAQKIEAHPGVYVLSVLPADTSLRVPKPALGVLKSPLVWWPWALALGVVLGVIALLWRRQRRRRKAAPPPSPLSVAEGALARVESLGLLEAGEPSRYVALQADILRGYLSSRVQVVSRSQTTSELVAALLGRALPLNRVAAVLEEADQVQFARRPVSVVRAKEIAREVKTLLTLSDDAFARDVIVPAASPKKVA
jgi:hypothetical protein